MPSDTNAIAVLPDIVALYAQTRPEAVALTCEERSLTFADLARRIDAAAVALARAGVKHGDRVAILSKNSEIFFELWFACGCVGAILVPVNWRLVGGEIAVILADSAPCVIVASGEFRSALDLALNSIEISPKVIPLETSGNGEDAYEAWRDRADGSGAGDAMARPEDVSIILYTSGTTGRPKGAMLTHRALIEMRKIETLSGPAWGRWSQDDVALVSMPLFHIGGVRNALSALFCGVQLLILREFDAAEIIDILLHRPISKLFVVPSALRQLVRHPVAQQRRRGFSLKYMAYGASPISMDLLSEALEVFGCDFVQSYGSTETGGVVLALSPEDHKLADGGSRMASAGKPLPGVELHIVTSDGQEAARGEIGEVTIRSPSNMAGYWNAGAATRETIDQNGWLRLGDAGFLDEDGYLHLRDRVKDMIITGGENVYPIEVENALATCPAIAEAAVFGVPSDRWGEEVMAAIVLRSGQTLSAGDIIAWVRERVAAYKAPKRIAFLHELPKNASGKVLKRVLRDQFRDCQAS